MWSLLKAVKESCCYNFSPADGTVAKCLLFYRFGVHRVVVFFFQFCFPAVSPLHFTASTYRHLSGYIDLSICLVDIADSELTDSVTGVPFWFQGNVSAWRVCACELKSDLYIIKIEMTPHSMLSLYPILCVFYSCLLHSVHLAVHCSGSSTHVCCTVLTLASLKGQMNMTSCDIRLQLEQMCQPLALQPGQFLSPRFSHTYTNMCSLIFQGRAWWGWWVCNNIGNVDGPVFWIGLHALMQRQIVNCDFIKSFIRIHQWDWIRKRSLCRCAPHLSPFAPSPLIYIPSSPFSFVYPPPPPPSSFHSAKYRDLLLPTVSPLMLSLFPR